MKELIKVVEKQGKQLVSIRELYKKLGLQRTNLSNWLKSNVENENFFIENSDWFLEEVCINGNETIDYNITLEFATHIINSAKSVSSKNKLELLKELGLIDKVDLISRKEIEFLDLLEKVLEPFELRCIRQYKVCDKYFVDLYISNLNIAIEYDENKHEEYSFDRHEGRQREITESTKIKFIRVDDSESNAYNVGVVIKNIFKYER